MYSGTQNLASLSAKGCVHPAGETRSKTRQHVTQARPLSTRQNYSTYAGGAPLLRRRCHEETKLTRGQQTEKPPHLHTIRTKKQKRHHPKQKLDDLRKLYVEFGQFRVKCGLPESPNASLGRGNSQSSHEETTQIYIALTGQHSTIIVGKSAKKRKPLWARFKKQRHQQ